MAGAALQTRLALEDSARCPRCGADLSRVLDGPWLLLRELQRLDEGEWRRALSCYLGRCKESRRA